MNFNGKVAIVTGGTKGIGLATVHKLAENGAKVYACSRKQNHELPSEVDFCELDVTKYESCKKLFDYIISKEKRVDILVTCAGIMRDALTAKMTDEMFLDVLNTNLKGTFNIVKLVGPYMELQGYGSIVTVSSIAANGDIGKANYSASKAGVIAMTKTWAKEFSRKGAQVRVNSIAPGCIKTDMLAQIPEKYYNQLANATMLKRLGEPNEIANVIAFLSSEEASYITGTVIAVDGGMRL